jgi:hypothetical protein
MVSTVEETEYFVALAKDYGIKTAGVMVEVPSADRPDHPRRGRLRLDRHERPHAVHDGRRPPARLGRVAQDPWHRPCSASSRRPPTAASATASPSASAARPLPTLLAVVLVGIGATTLSMAPTALADVRASLQYTREDAERIAAAALAADDAASARSAAQAAAENAASRGPPEGDRENDNGVSHRTRAESRPVGVQRFGTFLSGMIMPNIAAFIAWGFITMLFIPAASSARTAVPLGPVAEIIGGGSAADIGWQGRDDGARVRRRGNFAAYVGLVGPMVTYLCPCSSRTWAVMVYDTRGGVVAIATMGVIVGTTSRCSSAP